MRDFVDGTLGMFLPLEQCSRIELQLHKRSDKRWIGISLHSLQRPEMLQKDVVKVVQLFLITFLQWRHIHDGTDMGTMDQAGAIVVGLQTINRFPVLVA